LISTCIVSPDLQAVFKGPTSNGREGQDERRGRKGKCDEIQEVGKGGKKRGRGP